MNKKAQSHLELIESLGFRHVGEWISKDSTIYFEIEPLAKKRKWTLYAFVVGSEVFYLGKSTMLFEKRLNGYRRPGKSQRTNIRINPEIIAVLRSRKRVEIYQFEGAGILKFKGIDLNLAAALEDTLIELFSPPWNMNGRSKTTKKVLMVNVPALQDSK